jgi:hypothetical protein
LSDEVDLSLEHLPGDRIWRGDHATCWTTIWIPPRRKACITVRRT